MLYFKNNSLLLSIYIRCFEVYCDKKHMQKLHKSVLNVTISQIQMFEYEGTRTSDQDNNTFSNIFNSKKIRRKRKERKPLLPIQK